MPSFVHAPILWGLLLVGMPILIHLINLLRHKKVRWAAMEFLLESQRRNKNWIRLKQFLLLLLRVLAIAAAVLMFARPVLKDEWLRMFTGGLTHHIVLLDDSYSMADRGGEESAFDVAKQALARLATAISQENSPQAVTLLRFSRSQGNEGPQPDLLKQRVGVKFAEEFLQQIEPLKPSEMAIGPLASLRAIEQLVDDSRGDACIVYVFSDFREKDWRQPQDIRRQTESLASRGAQLRLVSCAEAFRDNLGIEKLVSLPGAHVAGVPMTMEISVRNHGASAANNVVASISEDGEARQSVLFDVIPSGEVATRTFPVNFAAAGDHRLLAQLPLDCLETDNTRSAVVRTKEKVQTLLISDDAETSDVRAFSTAINPGGSAVTGIAPKVESPSYLRSRPLNEYSSIVLLNCRALDEASTAALEDYAKNGGGIACFLGPEADTRFYNTRLYKEGQGLLPAPLSGPAELLSNRIEKTPDIILEKHPVFQTLLKDETPLLTSVLVEQYYALRKDWAIENAADVRLMARLANGVPLALEKRFGEGKFIVFLTTAGSEWNNWNRVDPSFVVTMLELQSYLAPSRGLNAELLVGKPWQWSVPQSTFQREAALRTYGGEPREESVTLSEASGQLKLDLRDTLRSGVYEITLNKLQGGQERRVVAVNEEPEEGALALAGSEGVAQALNGLKYSWMAASDLGKRLQAGGGAELTPWLLGLLLAVMAGEQLLAFSASSHIADRKGGE